MTRMTCSLAVVTFFSVFTSNYYAQFDPALTTAQPNLAVATESGGNVSLGDYRFVAQGKTELQTPSILFSGAMKCYGDACEDVVISFQGGCEVVINDGKAVVEVRSADKNGNKIAGIVTSVHARSTKVVMGLNGQCMTKYYVVGNHRADYAN